MFGSNFGGKDRLYESKQGVFLRRDGSLEGPLKAKKIQEWTRRVSLIYHFFDTEGIGILLFLSFHKTLCQTAKFWNYLNLIS